tara:strand:- start:318 stop:1151 length:834 start_codon:yes stop_codon:yes gene_type:complete
MKLDLEKSPLKSPNNVSSPLSNRIEVKVKDDKEEEEEDIFEDTIQHEEPKMKRKMSIKEIQDCNTKNKLKDYINEKKRKLDQSRRILELKYEKYKKCNDRWNIGTIVLSSLLTFIESTKLIFIDEDSSYIVKNIFDLTPIFFGTIITCSASIIKFKKYQEQMEKLNIMIDKCIIMIAKLKNIREEIKLMNDCGEEIQKIKNNYMSNICKEFSDVYQETERYITNDDYDVYLKLINDSDFNKHIMEYNKTNFYNTKLDNENIKDIVSNLKLKKENCCL